MWTEMNITSAASFDTLMEQTKIRREYIEHEDRTKITFTLPTWFKFVEKESQKAIVETIQEQLPAFISSTARGDREPGGSDD